MPSHPDDLVRLACGDVAVTVDLATGGRAVSWTVAGHELLTRYGDDPVQNGMYAMAPWAGRIRGNTVSWNGHDHALPVTYDPWALHGTALRQRGAILDLQQDADAARLVVRIEDHPGWPWPMAVDLTWELRDRTLLAGIAVEALVEPFPAVVGWHPWFRRRLAVGGDLEWSLAATDRLLRGDDHLPTGALAPFRPDDGPFDDAFAVPDGAATVRWPGVLALDVASDAHWYVVFDELPDCVCIEPQTGPPDGLHDGPVHAMRLAVPGQPHQLVTTWTMRDDRPGDRA